MWCLKGRVNIEDQGCQIPPFLFRTVYLRLSSLEGTFLDSLLSRRPARSLMTLPTHPQRQSSLSSSLTADQPDVFWWMETQQLSQASMASARDVMNPDSPMLPAILFPKPLQPSRRESPCFGHQCSRTSLSAHRHPDRPYAFHFTRGEDKCTPQPAFSNHPALQQCRCSP